MVKVAAVIAACRHQSDRISRRHCPKVAFTRESKNGTDATKTGTVPTVFAKKQRTFIGSATGP